jgi:hypothetical protein
VTEDRADQPHWPEIIKRAIEVQLSRLQTSLPGRVVTYDAAEQTAAVQLTVGDTPPLTDVPVSWPRGGGYFVHAPLTAGDHVWVHFCSEDFSGWREQGTQQPPRMLRRHGLYAYASPGAFVDGDELPDLPGHFVCGKVGGPQIHIDGTDVRLGDDSASDYVALASLVLARLTALHTAFDAHAHAVSGASTGPPTLLLGPPAAVAATVTKAK